MNDEHLYAEVVEELKRRGPIPGLWAKAYSEANGSEPQARALYLRYRAKQLAQVENDVIIRTSEKCEELDDLYAKFINLIIKYGPLALGIIVTIIIVSFLGADQ